MMRLFAALPLPEQVVEEIAAWQTSACMHLPAGEWRDVPPGNWHVTLAFYGETPGRDVDALAEALDDCAAGASPLLLATGMAGVFPGMQRPRVFWLGVEDAARRDMPKGGALKALARCCRNAGRATLRKRSAKEAPFRGHVTLARRRGLPLPMDPSALEAMPAPPALTWEADALILFRSELRRDGVRYRALERFALRGDNKQEV